MPQLVWGLIAIDFNRRRVPLTFVDLLGVPPQMQDATVALKDYAIRPSRGRVWLTSVDLTGVHRDSCCNTVDLGDQLIHLNRRRVRRLQKRHLFLHYK